MASMEALVNTIRMYSDDHVHALNTSWHGTLNRSVNIQCDASSQWPLFSFPGGVSK